MGTPYRFAGMQLDPETLLYYDHARYYSAAMGRFLSPDPIGVKGGVNLYAYVDSDPLNGVDVTGLADDNGDPKPMLCVDGCGGGTPLGSFDSYGGPSYTHEPGWTAGNGWDQIIVSSPPPMLIFGDLWSFEMAGAWTGGGGGGVEGGGGGGGKANPSNPKRSQPQSNQGTTCVGSGRGLQGNSALAGKQGGIPGQTVEPGTSAVIPQQFGFPNGGALAPYAPDIYGTVGNARFSSITDVMGASRQFLVFRYVRRSSSFIPDN